MVENRKPDWEYDCDRYTVRVYFGSRNKEERMNGIKEATADFFQKIRPELIQQRKLDKYSVHKNEEREVS